MNPSRLRTGVFLIITGVILLLNTTGQLAWVFWVDLVWLWPMLLIAIGVEKLLLSTKARNYAYVSSLILLFTVFWAYSAYAEGAGPDAPAYDFDADFTQAFPMDSTFKALVTDIDFGAGRMEISSTSNQLFDGEFYSEYGRPRVSLRESGDRAVVRITSRDSRRVHWPGSLDNKWRVNITDRLPVRLNIDCGAAHLFMNMEDIRMERLDLDCGVSEIDLFIGDKSPQVDCNITCGVSHVDIRIPQGAGLRVYRDLAISPFDTEGIKLRKRGSYRVTANYDDAPVQIDLDLSAGVSYFRVSYSDKTVNPGSI